MSRHYNNLSYSTITDARYDDGHLRVVFADGTSATVPATEVIPARVQSVRWDELTHEKHMVIAPTDGEPLAIPWDVFRVMTDPGFDAYLTKVEQRLQARESKRRAKTSTA